jgi:hypothetical protein
VALSINISSILFRKHGQLKRANHKLEKILSMPELNTGGRKMNISRTVIAIDLEFALIGNGRVETYCDIVLRKVKSLLANHF